jgi:MFS family permease
MCIECGQVTTSHSQMTPISGKTDRLEEMQAGYTGWRVLAAAIFGVMTGYSVLVPYTFSIFLKPLSATFGWRRDEISVALGCAAVTIAICAPMIGWLLDRYGPRRTILPCVVVFSLSFASLALLTHHLWHLYLVFVLLGTAGNGTTQLAYSRCISTWFAARRGLALSLISSGAGVGAMLLPLLAASLLVRHGWRTAYASLGLLVFVVSFPLTALLVKDSDRQAAAAKSGAVKRSIGDSLRAAPFILLVLAILLFSITFNGVVSHLSALMTDRGVPLRYAALALSTLGGCGLAGRLLAGFVLDRFSATKVSLIFFLTTSVGVLLLSRSGIPSEFAGAAMIGFSAGAESDITPYLLSRYFGLSALSTLYGSAWAAFGTGTAVGAVLMGRLYSTAGGYQPWASRLFALPTAISALLMLLMPAYPALESDGRLTDRVETEVPA